METIHIEQLTFHEKILFMESLWDGLCAKSEDVASQAWHGEVLQDREEALKNKTKPTAL